MVDPLPGCFCRWQAQIARANLSAAPVAVRIIPYHSTFRHAPCGDRCGDILFRLAVLAARTQERPMSLHTDIPDPDDMNEQRALWAEVALREFEYEVSGPQGMADTSNLDNVAS